MLFLATLLCFSSSKTSEYITAKELVRRFINSLHVMLLKTNARLRPDGPTAKPAMSAMPTTKTDTDTNKTSVIGAAAQRFKDVVSSVCYEVSHGFKTAVNGWCEFAKRLWAGFKAHRAEKKDDVLETVENQNDVVPDAVPVDPIDAAESSTLTEDATIDNDNDEPRVETADLGIE